MSLDIGVSALSFYAPRYTFDLKQLAEAYDLASDIFLRSLGQERMAYPPPCEDVITLAINAAFNLKKKWL